MFSVEPCKLPDNSLLSRYQDSGDFTDCYTTSVSGAITQAEYIQAFYTSVPFKMERFILRWAVSKPSSDEQARFLAEGKLDAFAAWDVEARVENQILMSDYRGQTRSWLMSEITEGASGCTTQLYFGSAVIKARSTGSEEPRMKAVFGMLVPFHRLYSQVLLASARD